MKINKLSFMFILLSTMLFSGCFDLSFPEVSADDVDFEFEFYEYTIFVTNNTAEPLSLKYSNKEVDTITGWSSFDEYSGEIASDAKKERLYYSHNAVESPDVVNSFSLLFKFPDGTESVCEGLPGEYLQDENQLYIGLGYDGGSSEMGIISSLDPEHRYKTITLDVLVTSPDDISIMIDPALSEQFD